MPRFWLISFLLLSQSILAQKEAFNWHFGNRNDLSFHSKPPAPYHKSQMYSNEGCCSISSSDGQLLFYSNGEAVWDSTHTIMPNGNGLYGANTTSQACLALPFPNKSNQYVLLTLDQIYGTHGLNYSLVDMTLNSGKGDIISTQKNISLLPQSKVSEKLSAVLHANGRDYWIICPQAGTDSFYAFLLDPNGINHQAVMSNTQFKLAWTKGTDKIGCLKSSPNGQYFAYTNIGLDTLVFGHFNHSTGKVTVSWAVYASQCYGVEFSPNSQLLYVTLTGNNRIQQYNCSNTKTAFQASLKYVATVPFPYGIQLGPDEKIYVNALSRDDISVFHAPDSIGNASRFQYRAIPLTSTYKDSRLGLPQYLPHFLFGNDILINQKCANDSTRFNFQNNNRDSAFWDFGDSNSQHNTLKGIQNIYHIYSKPGSYQVSVTYFKQGIAFKKFINVSIFKTEQIKVNNDTIVCNGQSAKLIAYNRSRFKTILWSNNSQQDTIFSSNSGQILIKATDKNNCQSSDTVKVTLASIQANIQYHDTAYCLKDNQFKLKAQYTIQNDSLLTTYWNFGDQSTSNDSVYTKHYQTAGVYTIKLLVESKQHCKDSFQRTLHVLPQPMAKINGHDTVYCFNQTTINYVTNQPSKKHIWWFGDGLTDTQKTVQHLYKNAGFFKLKLIQYDTNLCLSADSIMLRIQATQPIIQTKQFNYCAIEDTVTAKVQNPFIQYQWDWGDAQSSSGQFGKHLYQNAGKFIITCLVTDSFNCKGIDTINVSISNLKQRLKPYKDSLCQKQLPFNLLFNAPINQAKTLWSDGSIDSGSSQVKTFKQSGIYRGICISTDSAKCQYIDTITINILTSPKAIYSYEIKACEGQLLIQNTSYNYYNAKWQIDTQTAQVVNNQLALPKRRLFSLTLIVSDAQNICYDSVTQVIQIDSNQQSQIIIPNVFTPNQDAINNCYTFGGLNAECNDHAIIQIFDRWGIKVFEGDLATSCWNGKSKTEDPLSNGVYYYIVQIRTTSMNKTIEGIIHLIR